VSTQLEQALLLGVVYFIVVLLLPRRYRRILGLAGIGLFLLIVPFFMPKYQNDTLLDYAVYAMAALSLNLLIGKTGQISLGHGALLAISAYTVGIMVQQHHVSFYLAALVGALLATVVGLLLGLPAVRLTGPYLAIATLGLAIALPTLGKWTKVDKWTGGSQGIQIRSKYLPQVPGFLHTLPGGRHLQPDEFRLFLTLIVAALIAVIVWNFSRSRTGRAVVALRNSEPAASVMGINLARYKVLAFLFSAFIAGISGAFLAFNLASVHPDTFGLNLSIAILAMIVIGGLDSILGSVLGAVIIRIMALNSTSLPAPTDVPLLGSHLPVIFKNFPTYAAGVYYGLFLILVMILMPYGFAGAYYRLLRYPYRERLFRRRLPQTGDTGDTLPSLMTPPVGHAPRDVPKEVTRS